MYSLQESLVIQAQQTPVSVAPTTNAGALTTGTLADARLSNAIVRMLTTTAGLKAIVTAGLSGAVPIYFVVYNRMGKVTATLWQLQAAITAAVDNADQGTLVPTDFNAGTNNFLWYQIL